MSHTRDGWVRTGWVLVLVLFLLLLDDPCMCANQHFQKEMSPALLPDQVFKNTEQPTVPIENVY